MAQRPYRGAAARAFDDYDPNAVGTLNLVEALRRHCPEADLRKMRAHCPGWHITTDLRTTVSAIWEAWAARARLAM